MNSERYEPCDAYLPIGNIVETVPTKVISAVAEQLGVIRMTGTFVKVVSSQELPHGSLKTYDVQGKSVLLANVAGKIYAIGGVCNHRKWDLSAGMLEGEYVVCAGHAAKWNLKTGEGLFRQPLPPEPVYEVKVEDGFIYVAV